jgi:rhodanese-related sulfurtransferase
MISSVLSLALFLEVPAGATGIAASTPASQQSSVKEQALSRAAIDALLAQNGHVLFIDVRRADEIAAIGGFPAYLSIPLDQLAAHLDSIPKDRVIVPVSNHAVRGLADAKVLREAGFQVPGAVGVQTYQAEGGTLYHPAPPQPRKADASQAVQQK